MNVLIANASKVNLISLYQDMVTRMEQPIPATSTLARRRTDDLRQVIQTYLDASEGQVSVDDTEEGGLVFFDVEKETESAEDKKETRGRKPQTGDLNDIITVTIDKFPGREGSASYARRMLYRSGMTVGEFLAAAGEKGRGSLRKAVARGWVKVTKAEG